MWAFCSPFWFAAVWMSLVKEHEIVATFFMSTED